MEVHHLHVTMVSIFSVVNLCSFWTRMIFCTLNGLSDWLQPFKKQKQIS